MTKEVKDTASKIGRPRGSLNARTQDLFDIAQRLDCNPFEILIHFAKGDYEALGYSQYQTKTSKDGTTFDELTISPDARLKAAEKACEYLYPKRKAVEISTEDDEGRSSGIVFKLAYADK